jgi:hypothetical protein
VKIVTGIDDHSRYCVIAKAVMRATARPVCQAFLDAMGIYGVPEEVLSDNGTVFTGRFIKPRPAEVLFERICRENGITQRLTRPASPTTTGKIERLHQSLQNELLDDHGPFESIEALQAALDGWREEYNTDRPHQSLNMAFPDSRFTPAASPLDLRVPARQGLTPAPDSDPAPAVGPATAAGAAAPRIAIEADRLVPPSGNLWIGGQQIWLGPALAGKTITIWVDETTLHVLLAGTRLKTLPSRLGVTELARLAADGARPAGPSPLPAGNGLAIEVERMVNGAGLIGLAGTQLNVGYELAGQRVALRMEGTQMAVISHDGELLRTRSGPVRSGPDRHRLRGARRAGGMPAPSAMRRHDPRPEDRHRHRQRPHLRAPGRRRSRRGRAPDDQP